ncbi:unnamed protein product [Ambrosiozyma monospora]|uniref:DNA topoisomerase n=1 Tax=Ambrosiozyma monospora TaxID=43982 RepID=A0A9W6YVN7_AMBMO|nr:unnamed protein product [Ambrosiozyma monospora]
MKVLCVAEKNSISKSVSHTLGGGRVTTRNSSITFVKNYDFTFEFSNWGRCDVTMTCVAGHITGIDFPPDYKWGRCDPGALYHAPLQVQASNRNAQKIADNIKKEARNANYLMIWTDCDREGEYIGWEIVQEAAKGNRNFTVDNAWRAQFAHLERNHVIHAAHNPGRLDKNAIDAVRTRMEIDLITGSSFTRFLTGFMKNAIHYLKDGDIISYGGCQFPTLGKSVVVIAKRQI